MRKADNLTTIIGHCHVIWEPLTIISTNQFMLQAYYEKNYHSHEHLVHIFSVGLKSLNMFRIQAYTTRHCTSTVQVAQLAKTSSSLPREMTGSIQLCLYVQRIRKRMYRAEVPLEEL